MLDKVPEHGGHFKITKQADGSIWIASRKWPTECYYMSARRWKGTEFAYVESNANRNVKGKAGKPGPEGQWILTKAAK